MKSSNYFALMSNVMSRAQQALHVFIDWNGASYTCIEEHNVLSASIKFLNNLL